MSPNGRYPCPRTKQLWAVGASRSGQAPTFHTPRSLITKAPDKPAVEIPPHYKRINTFVATDFPARTLKAHQAVANALGLIKEGNPASLFNLSTYHGRFAIKDPDEFEELANEKFKPLFDFQAAYAAPLLQTARQEARQDVIIIPDVGDPVALTIHLRYRMDGEYEYCWLIDHFSESNLTRPAHTSSSPETATRPDSS